MVLDCGANVGSFARMAAPVVGPKGTIYCIEPMPDVCTALQLNILKYKEWADKQKMQVANVIALCAGGVPRRLNPFHSRHHSLAVTCDVVSAAA